MLRSESSSRMSIAAVWELFPRRPCQCYHKQTSNDGDNRKCVPRPLRLASFCILAESFGRLKGSIHNKTVGVSINQDVIKTDVGWPRVTPKWERFSLGGAQAGSAQAPWSQGKSACGPAPTHHDCVINMHHWPTMPQTHRRDVKYTQVKPAGARSFRTTTLIHVQGTRRAA